MTKTLLAAFLVECLVIPGMLIVVADQVAHTHVEQLGGVNIWGYRGAVAHQRQPNEIRIVFVGGTRAFGWGGAASESVPAAVRWMVTLTTDRPHDGLRPVVGVNLGAIGAPAFTYAATLDHFAYLRPDFICIYDDLEREPARLHRSAVYVASGYAPALPLVLEEKGMALQYGSVRAAYGDGPVVATSLGRRIVGRVLRGVGSAAGRLDESSLAQPPGSYADHMSAAVDVARRLARGVIVAVGPAETDRERENVRALRARLSDRLAHDRALRLVDLTNAPGLTDRTVMLDGYNYSAAGRARVGAAITPVLLQLIEADTPAR
jgi:hypothetical protein